MFTLNSCAMPPTCCYGCGIVSFREECRLPWWQSVIVIAAFALAGVIGCGLGPVELVASVPPPPVLVSLAAEDVEGADLDHGSSLITHKAVGATTLRRAAPPRLRSSPLWRWWRLLAYLTTFCYRLSGAGSYPPVTCLAGRERLTRFCTARR